jgi:hypothetical protein
VIRLESSLLNVNARRTSAQSCTQAKCVSSKMRRRRIIWARLLPVSDSDKWTILVFSRMLVGKIDWPRDWLRAGTGAQKGTDENRFAYPLRRCLARRWTPPDFCGSSVAEACEGCGKGRVNSGRNRAYSQGRDDAPGRSSTLHLDASARTDLWSSDSVTPGRRRLLWCSDSCADRPLYRSRGSASPPRPRIRSLVLYSDAQHERF